MKAIYYNTMDRWGEYWRLAKEDSPDLDVESYPIYPAVNYLKNGGLILEAGCGLGRLAKWLAKNKFNVVAMELEEYSIGKLKEDSPALKCVRGDACELPFADNSFRYIFLMGVIDVFLDDSKRDLSLSEVKRVLAKGGVAFVSVPHAGSIFWVLYALRRSNFLRKIFGKPALEQHVGQFAFTRKEITALMNMYFRNFEINYVNCRMGFFYIFPFFRSRELRGVSFPELQRQERNSGEKVYKLNMAGEWMLEAILAAFRRFISPTLYVIIKNE